VHAHFDEQDPEQLMKSQFHENFRWEIFTDSECAPRAYDVDGAVGKRRLRDGHVERGSRYRASSDIQKVGRSEVSDGK
jgi:hypothetical protein